jgi:hypothetical protein
MLVAKCLGVLEYPKEFSLSTGEQCLEYLTSFLLLHSSVISNRKTSHEIQINFNLFLNILTVGKKETFFSFHFQFLFIKPSATEANLYKITGLKKILTNAEYTSIID